MKLACPLGCWLKILVVDSKESDFFTLIAFLPLRTEGTQKLSQWRRGSALMQETTDKTFSKSELTPWLWLRAPWFWCSASFSVLKLWQNFWYDENAMEGRASSTNWWSEKYTRVLLEVGTVHCLLLATPPLTSTTLQYLPLLNIHNAMCDKEVIKLEIWLTLK